MEKKIYVPSMEKLYLMQDMIKDRENILYEYLIVKVVELLILEGMKYPSKGILKNTYKYFREDPEIAYAICRLYPSELKYSNIAKNDVSLCLNLVREDGKNRKYSLDNLSLFDESIMTNKRLLEEVSKILLKILSVSPEYRFEYKDNKLLNDIFSVNISIDGNYSEQLLEYLSYIEPFYLVNNKDILDDNILYKAIETYISRYGVSSNTDISRKYKGKDILTSKEEKVKRLIRYIDKSKEIIY